MSEHLGVQEISVIKDDQGILFLGDSSEIKTWLDECGLASREFSSKVLKTGASALRAATQVSSESGRWVKLTKESVGLLEKYGKAGGIQPGVVQDASGKIVKWLKFETPDKLFSPAMATGIAGMMTQMALEQAIQEITDYLVRIDGKINDLLQDQKDRTLADLMGAVFEVDEAAAIRNETGMLTDAAWSKLAPCARVTGTALAYALTKLKGISDKLLSADSPEDVESVLKVACEDVPAWLGVIARAIQTRDRLSVIELERAYFEKPEVLEGHRQGINKARRDRLGKVRARVEMLRETLSCVAERMRGEKLLHPFAVDSSLGMLCELMDATTEFSEKLGMEIAKRGIERAPEWDKAFLEFVDERAKDVAEVADQVAAGAQDLGEKAVSGAQDLGNSVAQGAGALGDAAGKGAEQIGAAVSSGAQEIGKALEGIDLGKAIESLPFRFPFGK